MTLLAAAAVANVLLTIAGGLVVAMLAGVSRILWKTSSALGGVVVAQEGLERRMVRVEEELWPVPQGRIKEYIRRVVTDADCPSSPEHHEDPT